MGESRKGLVSDGVIEWIEEYCRVPQGTLVGQPIRLTDKQKEFIRAVYDNPHITRRAILSMARKGGKTALCALLLLVHLCGPLARVNSQLFSAAQSRDQAALLFELAAQVIRMSPTLNDLVVIRDTAKQLYCPTYGTHYRALSADATTAFGLSPVFILHDELGQVRGPRSQLYEALETATAAHDHPLSFIISTQAPSDGDLLSQLIDDAEGGHDPKVVLKLHTAPMDDDPFAEETIRKANPHFGVFQNPAEVMAMAEAARRMPSREAAYRNLVLNQRVETENPFVTPQVWQENSGEIEGWGTCYGGLDLSHTTDLTALVLVSQVDGIVGVKPTFWLPGEGLAERSRADSVPYDVWADQGYLKTTPGRSIEYRDIAVYLAKLFQTEDVRKIGFDRWNMRHLRPWLVEAGLSEAFIDDRFVEFGQGYVSMSPALRTLEALLVNAKCRHENHPVLLSNARNAVVKMDEAGNRKLDKRKSRGRIDGMIALAMAAAVMEEDLKGGRVFPVDPARFTENLRATA